MLGEQGSQVYFLFEYTFHFFSHSLFYEHLCCLVSYDLCVIWFIISNSGIHTENKMFEEECRQINKNGKEGENARAWQLSVRMIFRGPWSLLKERQSDNSSMFSATALN